jgi:hypothetical protein
MNTGETCYQLSALHHEQIIESYSQIGVASQMLLATNYLANGVHVAEFE